MSYMEERWKTREIQLERVKHAVGAMYPEAMLANIRAISEWDMEAAAIRMRVERMVWSQRLADETIRWPATWWDAVKERWAPRWWLVKHPVQYKHADFTIYRGYPDLVMPERQSAIFMMQRMESHDT